MSAFFLALLLQAAAAESPAPFVPGAAGWVKDEADILRQGFVDDLNGRLAAHEQATSNQVVVLTVPSLEGEVVESVALRRATQLRIGQKGKHNGVLLLVAPNERKVRIEVGYGLEGPLPDARAAQIVRGEILPRFRANDVEGGIDAGVRAILGSIEGTYSPSAAQPVDGLLDRVRFLPVLDAKGQFLAGFFSGIGFLILGILLWGAEDRRFRWVRTGLGLGAPLVVLGANYPLALLGLGLFAVAILSNKLGLGSGSGAGSDYSYSSGGGSSWSSSSSSGSSSFSGGGGSFGGGGASGSW